MNKNPWKHTGILLPAQKNTSFNFNQHVELDQICKKASQLVPAQETMNFNSILNPEE